MGLKFIDDRCSGCRACELICTLQNFKVVNPVKAMLRVRGEFPVPGKFIVDVCDQCGECANACPNEAIILKGGAYRIIKENCDQCMACVDACRLKLVKVDNSGFPYKCVNCKQCVTICPRDALVFERSVEKI